MDESFTFDISSHDFSSGIKQINIFASKDTSNARKCLVKYSITSVNLIEEDGSKSVPATTYFHLNYFKRQNVTLSTKQPLALVDGVYEVFILVEIVDKPSATLKATVIKDHCYTLLDNTPKTELELF